MLPGHFASSLENSDTISLSFVDSPKNPAVEGRCALKAGPSCLSAWLDQPNAFGHRSPCLSISSPPSDKQNPGLDLAKTVGPPAISAIAVARLLPIQPTLADGGWRPEPAWPSLASVSVGSSGSQNAQRRLFTLSFASSDRLLPNSPRDPDPANQTADASLLTPEHQCFATPVCPSVQVNPLFVPSPPDPEFGLAAPVPAYFKFFCMLSSDEPHIKKLRR
ncbi:uncharacterized protein CLUP02_14743 [Colletotrichum lupini]|uniref:Uncharacterized protein n=1 Tax=Colletotrichum lupini TaxID=145971 RepID=A0A9Q8T5J3_9PEZI|nr:uncharacterized protein CLUP02_14743 [Colletotrichum lupini]UQC89215.1 hypothetical protein CLUP02_14743 [Colletotrichum lupini]